MICQRDDSDCWYSYVSFMHFAFSESKAGGSKEAYPDLLCENVSTCFCVADGGSYGKASSP